MRERDLLKQFPKSPFLAKVKVWTPQRNSADIAGPYDEVPGELLLMVASRAHAKGEELDIMRECMEKLKAIHGRNRAAS